MLSPDETTIASGSGSEIRLWSAADGPGPVARPERADTVASEGGAVPSVPMTANTLSLLTSLLPANTDFFTSFNYDRFCALYYSIKKIQSPVTKEEFINTENMTLEDANECSGGICFTQAYVLRDRLVKVGFRNAYVIGVWDEHQKISTFPVVKHLAVLIVGKKDGVTTYIFLDGSTNVSSPIEFASENDTKVLNNHTFILNVKKRALINYNAPYHLILDLQAETCLLMQPMHVDYFSTYQ